MTYPEPHECHRCSCVTSIIQHSTLKDFRSISTVFFFELYSGQGYRGGIIPDAKSHRADWQALTRISVIPFYMSVPNVKHFLIDFLPSLTFRRRGFECPPSPHCRLALSPRLSFRSPLHPSGYSKYFFFSTTCLPSVLTMSLVSVTTITRGSRQYGWRVVGKESTVQR